MNALDKLKELIDHPSVYKVELLSLTRGQYHFGLDLVSGEDLESDSPLGSLEEAVQAAANTLDEYLRDRMALEDDV